MEQSQLHYPFSWEKRCPTLFKGVFFIPPYFEGHQPSLLPDFADPLLFGNTNPVCIEYCSGTGDWIIDRALRYPGKNWIAVEKKFDRVQKIWSKMQRTQITNLLIVAGDAQTLNQYYLPSFSVDALYVNFPDPWPKRSHAKHRLIQSPFIKESGRILKKEGELIVVTDDPSYSLQIIETLHASTDFVSTIGPPYYVTSYPDYGSSFFESLWRSKGFSIRYHSFQKSSP